MEEMIKEARWSLTKKVLELVIPKLLEDPEDFIDLKEFGYCPGNILEMFYELGWEYEFLDEDGREQNTQYELFHPVSHESLILNYSGQYWTMYLQAKDN